MARFKTPLIILVYVFAVWHGYVLLARPLVFHEFPMPFRDSVLTYAKALHVDQAWAYFYKPPATNTEVYYSVNGGTQLHRFFGSAPEYLLQRRYYRCVGCANAAYQLKDNLKLADGSMLIGHYLCAFYSSSDQLKVEARTAPYNSPDFQTVNVQEIACSGYR